MSTKNKLNILKQIFYNLDEADKIAFLNSLNLSPHNANSVLPSKEVTVCPHCGSAHFVKNGTKLGRQRYLCRKCNKSFVQNSGTILFRTHKGIDVWKKYVQCMIDKLPLRRCAEECEISLPTAFAWRHKILDVLRNMMAKVELEGIVEADETFFRISYKGNKKFSNSHLSRDAKKRGTGASQRGISKEQVCVPCGVNLDGKSIALISNLGKPRFIDIRAVFAGHIVKGSVLVTDSLRAYQRLSLDMDLYHIQIEHNRHRNGIFNIQTINSYHSRLKDLVLRVFKGVATKYLNNYLVYHNLVNISKESRREKVLIFLKFIHETLYYIRTIDIPRRPAIPVINY